MATRQQDEWQSERNPDTLLRVVTERRDYARRLRLFGCVCARQVWHLLPTDARSAVQTSERLAEGRATITDLRAAAVRLSPVVVKATHLALAAAGYASEAIEPVRWAGALGRAEERVYSPAQASWLAARALASEAAGPAPQYVPESWHDAWNAAFAAARAVQADYVRDIFPPPGFAPHLDPDWRTSTVVALARQMDESGDFSAVPILADALQDAGCDTDALLQCSRVPGNVHVRGNWVVDLVLGRQ